MAIIAIAGIDTGIGKTHITGLLARSALEKGQKVTTAKIVQTGCTGISEDIITHRKMMDRPLDDFDKNGITCPYVFPFPASPHLAAQMANTRIDKLRILECLKMLGEHFDIIFLEGAGGLMVPLSENYLFIDFLQEAKIPTILVSSMRLGSINHTLLSIEALSLRGIELKAIIMNEFDETKPEIARDTPQYLAQKTHAPVIMLSELSFRLDGKTN